MKRFFSLFLALMLVLSMSAAAMAENTPPASEISADPNHASYSWRNEVAPASSEIGEVTYVESGISKNSSSSVFVEAVTETNPMAYVITGSLEVQRWYNNKWEYYDSVDFCAYDTTYYRAHTVVSVESGYYYRLKSIHVGMFMDGSESYTATTKSVYVN